MSLVYEKKYADYDIYTGDAWKHEVKVYSLKGFQLLQDSFDFIIRKTIEYYAWVNGETPIYLTIDEQPPVDYKPTSSIIKPLLFTWITHTSPGIALSLPAVASILTGIGFVILAASTSKFFWTAPAETIGKVFEFPKYLLILALIPMVSDIYSGKKKKEGGG